MINWYSKVTKNITLIPDCIAHFELELVKARMDLTLKGDRLERHAATLPGITEQRYSELQEIEAILEFLNIEYKKKRSIAFRKYTVGFDKALSSRDADKYVDGDDEVVNTALLNNEFALLRNRYLALMKGLEAKHWELSNIVKLRCAGIEDASIG